MMRWVPTTVGHLDELEIQPAQAAARAVVDAIVLDDELSALLPELARTLLSSAGKPLAVVGIWPRSAGVAEVWALFSRGALRHPKTLYEGAQRWMRVATERDGWERFETVMDPRHVAAVRWVEHLGFEPTNEVREVLPGGRRLPIYGRAA